MSSLHDALATKIHIFDVPLFLIGIQSASPKYYLVIEGFESNVSEMIIGVLNVHSFDTIITWHVEGFANAPNLGGIISNTFFSNLNECFFV
jgi:hypothetical protein